LFFLFLKMLNVWGFSKKLWKDALISTFSKEVWKMLWSQEIFSKKFGTQEGNNLLEVIWIMRFF
jgi:hypothetical protein